MRRSEPRPRYTRLCTLQPGSWSACPAAHLHWLRLLRQTVREDPVRPAALAVLVGQEVRQDPARPFHLLARPRRVPPLAPVRSPLRKWKAQLQLRYFSHAHPSCRSALSSTTNSDCLLAPRREIP